MGDIRDACDRCHALKTRCVRASQSHVCMRCRRLGVLCHFSPPGRTGRPAGRRRSLQNAVHTNTRLSSQNNDQQIHLDLLKQQDFGFLAETPYLEDSHISMDSMETLLTGNFCWPTESPGSLPEDLFSEPPVEELPDQHIPQLLSANQERLLPRLLELQSGLVDLERSLRDSANGSRAVAHIFQNGELLAGIIDGVISTVETSPEKPSPQPSGILLLLLSSCYFTLIHVCELVVQILHREANLASTPRIDTEDAVAYQQDDGVLPGSPGNRLPSISIGTVRLPMSGKDAADIYLRLMSQMIHRLRDSLQQCNPRVETTPPLSTTSSCNSPGPCMERSTNNILSHLTQPTFLELGKREKNLLALLWTSTITGGR